MESVQVFVYTLVLRLDVHRHRLLRYGLHNSARVYGTDSYAESHNKHLHSMFGAMAKHYLKLNGEKCVFAALAIELVGFHLSADGTYPLHSNTEGIHRVPDSTSAAQLASPPRHMQHLYHGHLHSDVPAAWGGGYAVGEREALACL